MPDGRKPDRPQRLKPIRAEWLRKVADAIVQRIDIVGGRVSRVGTNIVIEVDHKKRSKRTTTLALITGHASLATNRWKYSWSEAEMNGDNVQVKSGGRSGSTSSDYAINIAENYHDSQYAFGVDMNLTSYSDTGFAPRPVGAMGDADTHDKNVPVELHIEKDANGNTVRWFQQIWTHQGACS